jgi:hypothetical protein
MQFKFTILLLFLMLSITSDLKSQSVSSAGSATFTFPDDWLGKWSGTLEIYNGNSIRQKVSMTLNNQLTDSTDVFLWTIQYGDDPKTGLRDYRLRTVDSSKGHYVVDEQNSIFLDAWLAADKLISWFEVNGSVLQSVYERREDHMIFEISVTDNTPIRLSGNTTFDNEEIPEVKSYKLKNYQRAILSKQQ